MKHSNWNSKNPLHGASKQETIVAITELTAVFTCSSVLPQAELAIISTAESNLVEAKNSLTEFKGATNQYSNQSMKYNTEILN